VSIAIRAGQVVAGFARVEAAIASDPIVALIHASDASPDGMRKIAAAVKRRYGDVGARLAIIECFSSSDLDLALGRPNVIHAALLAGHASEAVLSRWRNLERFRMADVGDRGGGMRRLNENA
jgi:hypothetical protein